MVPQSDSEEATNKETVKPLTRRLVYIAIAVLVVIVFSCYLFIVAPHNRAMREFQDAASAVQQKNAELQEKIEAGQQALDTGETPFDIATKDNLTVLIASSKQELRQIPNDLPYMASGIDKKTEELRQPLDFAQDIQKLQEAKEGFEKSVRQLKQVTAPTQDFVISRLGQVADVSDLVPATEENDPNHHLNKPRGYTANIFFSYSKVKDQYGQYSGKNSIEKGTDGGGCIEVFANTEDANARNEYLSAFDGIGLLDSGSHEVVGTVLIRTSHHLTATQQKELTAEIKSALTTVQ